MKNTICGKTIDPISKDPRKRVSFEGLERIFHSTISRPGEKGDINETIELSRSHKLMSPHRKRTAAYTQATKSSMKITKGRDMSANSARKDGEGVFAPLGMSTPAKFTHANKSTIGKFQYTT